MHGVCGPKSSNIYTATFFNKAPGLKLRFFEVSANRPPELLRIFFGQDQSEIAYDCPVCPARHAELDAAPSQPVTGRKDLDWAGKSANIKTSESQGTRVQPSLRVWLRPRPATVGCT
jgi:hypothetical protein